MATTSPDCKEKTTTVDEQSVASTQSSSTSTTTATTPKDSSSSSSSHSSWRSKLHIHHSTPSVPGKEKWRDASLSDKERWKEWQKAKDKERMQGSTAGFYTQFYKGEGKSGYWADMGV